MGYPPGAKTLVFWYEHRERITWATLWNLSHNVGGALAPVLIGFSFGFSATVLWSMPGPHLSSRSTVYGNECADLLYSGGQTCISGASSH